MSRSPGIQPVRWYFRRGGAAGSQAMPMAKPTAAPLPIETVGWRCGPRWHMNRWGNCVPNHRMMIRPVRHWHPGFWYHHRWHAGYWAF
ncbi:GCG_CRPN prefix-to-repeats domain-containing protein [Mesorhizobium sp. IMUNJ 23033]|uniref:GCG_CRPN prefix-to-repeats domain-containing protein n=1 Tax=Mesorhizobium sp. IMUNJ 23033 TaxID=3378039 RepID=UPI00384EE36C